MSSKDFHKEIVEHLEFLGYELESLKPEQGYTYIARDPNKSTLLVRIFNLTTILTTRWSGFQTKAADSKDFFVMINEVNQENMGKWYYELSAQEDEIIVLTEMDYYGYEKKTFGQLVNSLEAEVRANLPKFQKFLPED